MNITPFSIEEEKVFYQAFQLKGITSTDFTILYTDGDGYKWILKDAKGIWWFYAFSKRPKLKFLTKDQQNFKVINDDFAKDQQNVFLIAKSAVQIPKADPETFVVLEGTPYFAKDKNQLYAIDSSYGLFMCQEADANAIVPIGWCDYITDKDHVYYFKPPLVLSNQSKYTEYFDENCDVNHSRKGSNFEKNKAQLLEKYPDIVGWWHPKYTYNLAPSTALPLQGYHKTDHAVFYIFSSENAEKLDYAVIRAASLHSFKILSIYYAKDPQQVYFKNSIIADADAASFCVIDQKLAKDKNHVYYNGHKTSCDLDSFKVIYQEDELAQNGITLVVKDRQQYYADSWVKLGKSGIRTGYTKLLEPLKDIVDLASFRVLNGFWAQDNQSVYYNLKAFPKGDTVSFKLLENHLPGYAQDQQNLYLYGKIVKGIDGSSFKCLNSFWGKDAQKVYNFKTGRIQSKIDAHSFRVLDVESGAAEDKDFNYYFNDWGELKKKKK